MAKAKSLKEVNIEIHKKYPMLHLAKGVGYFWLRTDDTYLQHQLASLYTTRINVFKISDQTISQWLRDVEEIVNDSERHSTERKPVMFKKLQLNNVHLECASALLNRASEIFKRGTIDQKYWNDTVEWDKDYNALLGAIMLNNK